MINSLTREQRKQTKIAIMQTIQQAVALGRKYKNAIVFESTQNFEGREAAIMVVNGRRICRVKTDGGRNVRWVPLELLRMAAGLDKWMRKIRINCANCGESHEAGKMENLLCWECDMAQDYDGVS